MAPRMLSIIRLNSSSLRTGSLGMWMRPKWLVTPRGRMASNSGCTDVLVEGATTPNFLRKPRASVMGVLRLLWGGAPRLTDRPAARHGQPVYDRPAGSRWSGHDGPKTGRPRREDVSMLRTGREHLESLRDGRVVYVGGERIDDVTRHPAFRTAAETVAAIYDMKADPANRDVMSYEEDGGRHSIYFLLARTRDDLQRRMEGR